MGFSKKAKEETGSAYYIAVLDREGKVLYEGPIPVLYRKDRDDSYHIESYFGDSKDLYFVIYDGLGKDCTQVLLRYELTEDGLTEHVIWEVPTPSP